MSSTRKTPEHAAYGLLPTEVADTEGAAILSDAPQPWQEKPVGKGRSRLETHARVTLEGPIPEAELGAIAAESSQENSKWK